MRYRYMPKPERPSPDDMYPCGYLNTIICGEDGHVKTGKLLEMLQGDVEPDESAAALMAESLQFVTYVRYELIPKTITEIVFSIPEKKRVVALYTAVVGGGDDCGRIASASLDGLAAALEGLGAPGAAGACRALEGILDSL